MNLKLRKTVTLLSFAVLLMFGFSFALVPLYRVACKAIGLNTTIPVTNKADMPVSLAEMDISRHLAVQFIAVRNQELDWDFRTQTKRVDIYPGATTKVMFYAKNNTDHDMTVQPVPSMTPTEAITHFHKLECFCFRQQTLKAGEAKDMALVFQVDKHLPKDVHTITLAYTLFDVTPKSIKPKLEKKES